MKPRYEGDAAPQNKVRDDRAAFGEETFTILGDAVACGPPSSSFDRRGTGDKDRRWEREGSKRSHFLRRVRVLASVPGSLDQQPSGTGGFLIPWSRGVVREQNLRGPIP